MTTSTFLIKNIASLMASNAIMGGGNKLNGTNKSSFIFYSLILVFISLLLKGFIVHILYNYLVPKLMYSLSKGNNSLENIESNFKPISFTEAILLVILANTLFSS